MTRAAAAPQTAPADPGVTTASARPVRAVIGATRGIRNPIVLIDGPSGAGKSTFADALRANWPGAAPALVRLDDVYQGWWGLERASLGLAHTLVRPVRRGAVGNWQRWDWARDRPAGRSWLLPGSALIVEGCGAFEAGRGSSDALHVWVDATDEVRKRRALDRDGGAYDPFWQIWDRQWRRYVHRTAPQRRADLRVHALSDGDAGRA